jgi:hypothetical protein
MPKTTTSGQGRKKGVPNKLTADLKAMILGALDDAGGQAYLARQAYESPGAFMALIGKVLPLQVTGQDGAAMAIDFRWADPPPAEREVTTGTGTLIAFATRADGDGEC